jgi:tetratricopeptide (TPR) repeat protein
MLVPFRGVFSLLSLLIVLCLFSFCFAGHYNEATDGPLDANIEKFKQTLSVRGPQILKKSPPSIEEEVWLATAYKNLGLMLQSKGIRQHLGGDRIQREALDNYNKALTIDNGRTKSLSIQINYLKGMLLKMMGFGDDSLASYLAAEQFELSDHDLASVYFHKADVLQMMGRVEEANTYFRLSLDLKPCRVERYYQYVNSCNDLKSLGKPDWIQLLDNIQAKLKLCENKDSSLIESTSKIKEVVASLVVDGKGIIKPGGVVVNSHAKRKHRKSYLLFDDSDYQETAYENEEDNHGEEDEDEADEEDVEDYAVAVLRKQQRGKLRRNSHATYAPMKLNSAVYWALFTVAEKAGRPALAWWYLEYANKLEKELRENKFNREDATQQANQIMGAFTPELINSLTYMKGKGSKVPIFIIGFMRYVWFLRAMYFLMCKMTLLLVCVVPNAPQVRVHTAGDDAGLPQRHLGYGRGQHLQRQPHRVPQ